jgi:hypothetical protein
VDECKLLPVTTRNWRATPFSPTTTEAVVRSMVVKAPSRDDRRYITSTPGVLATSHRFCHRRKLFTQMFTYRAVRPEHALS